jgi:hypothetical protein
MMDKARIAIGTLVGCLRSTGHACNVSLLIRASCALPLGLRLPFRESNPVWNIAERSQQVLFVTYHFQSSSQAAPNWHTPVE